jgi:peptidoglycan/LPS O-acetylase OafA/YrhL
MSMTSSLSSLYCSMEASHKSSKWFDPGLHLLLTIGASLITAILAFRSVELDQQTVITFVTYYIILGSMAIMFIYRLKLTDPKTRQLLQFGFFLLGFVLMVTGILGILGGNLAMSIVFLITVFLPGLACARAGRHFNNIGE